MFTKLLVPLDRSVVAERAVGSAGAIARAAHAAVDIVLVHSPEMHPHIGLSDEIDARRLAEEEQYTFDIARELAADGAVTTTHAVLSGDIVANIVARAHDQKSDLIVMTSHGRTGASRAWLGSIADGIIRRANTPVLMLRSGEGRAVISRDLFHTILVPLDGSPEGLAVLDAATTLAQCGKTRLALLQVIQPVPLITGDATIGFMYPSLVPDDVATGMLVNQAHTYLTGVAHSLASRGFTDVVQDVLVAGGVAQGILECAGTRQADLIAMSTHGRGASRLLLGSVADKVVRGSRLPVLLFHPEHSAIGTPPDAPSRVEDEVAQYSAV